MLGLLSFVCPFVRYCNMIVFIMYGLPGRLHRQGQLLPWCNREYSKVRFAQYPLLLTPVERSTKIVVSEQSYQVANRPQFCTTSTSTYVNSEDKLLIDCESNARPGVKLLKLAMN